MIGIQVKEHGLIRSAGDISRLGIVDWSKLRPFHNDISLVTDIITGCMGEHASYVVVKVDLREYPKREDWPGWEHIGKHVPIAQLFWNFFHANYTGELYFWDAPDFQGILKPPTLVSPARFWGDIGQVSVSAFIYALRFMNAHDLWISVIDEETLVVIELLWDLLYFQGDMWSSKLNPTDAERHLTKVEERIHHCPYRYLDKQGFPPQLLQLFARKGDELSALLANKDKV